MQRCNQGLFGRTADAIRPGYRTQEQETNLTPLQLQGFVSGQSIRTKNKVFCHARAGLVLMSYGVEAPFQKPLVSAERVPNPS